MPNPISRRINETLRQFYQDAVIRDYLTEDDLRCHLFCELNNVLITFNNVSVHAEIRWYGDERRPGTKKLKYRSDLVVIDRNTLDDHDTENITMPSKGYGFHDYFAIIELKLRRPNNKESDFGYYRTKIHTDINKLKKIRSVTSNTNSPVYWMIFIDKKKGEKHAWVVPSEGNNVREI